MTCVRSDLQAVALVARFSLLRELDCSDLHGLPLADLGALAGLRLLRSLAVRGNYRTGAAELQQVRFRAPQQARQLCRRTSQEPPRLGRAGGRADRAADAAAV